MTWSRAYVPASHEATLLDQSGASARMIADQLGHSRVSMTQDVYMGPRAGNLAALEAYNPDVVKPSGEPDDRA